jgi:5TMR of 5TMR-LYT
MDRRSSCLPLLNGAASVVNHLKILVCYATVQTMMVESRGCGRVSESEIGVTLAQGLGIMALMALSFGSIERLNWLRCFRSILTGMVFGAGAIIAMPSPATIAPGVIIDARQFMLGVAAAFGGVPAAIVSATIACLYRISIGGGGVGTTTPYSPSGSQVPWRSCGPAP